MISWLFISRIKFMNFQPIKRNAFIQKVQVHCHCSILQAPENQVISIKGSRDFFLWVVWHKIVSKYKELLVECLIAGLPSGYNVCPLAPRIICCASRIWSTSTYRVTFWLWKVSSITWCVVWRPLILCRISNNFLALRCYFSDIMVKINKLSSKTHEWNMVCDPTD